VGPPLTKEKKMKRRDGHKYTREMRREEAEKRQLARENLTSQQQLDVLDFRLGKDTGAIKERTRLLKKMAEETQKTRRKK